MAQVTVSVIIPVYNTRAYLEKCVDSVLAQTFEDYELILVNDGSTDDSPGICDRYQRQDPRIRVIHKENGGLSSARNAGLDIAAGNYICFVDSDDHIAPTLLEKTVPLMDGQGLDCVCFGMQKETAEGVLLEKIHYIPRNLRIGTEEERLEFLLKYLLNYRIGWEACNRIFRAGIIQKNRLRFVSERTVFAEDLLFSFLYWLHADSCLVIHDILYHYVQHKNSLMDAGRARNVLPQIHALSREAYKYVRQKNLPLIREHYGMIHLHLLEWQTRAYVADKGIAWVKQEINKLDHGFFLPEGTSLEEAYRNSLEYCGKWDGFVTVVLQVPEEASREKTAAWIRALQEQTLQKLDVLLLVREKTGPVEKDIRIRQVVTDISDPENAVRTAFAESCGEYLYFADAAEYKQKQFLEKGADILKYNNCGTFIFSPEGNGFLDMQSLSGRYGFRKYLKDAGIPSHRVLLRSDLLEKSGLACMNDLRGYMADILLSDHVIFVEEDKQVCGQKNN